MITVGVDVHVIEARVGKADVVHSHKENLANFVSNFGFVKNPQLPPPYLIGGGVYIVEMCS